MWKLKWREAEERQRRTDAEEALQKAELVRHRHRHTLTSKHTQCAPRPPACSSAIQLAPGGMLRVQRTQPHVDRLRFFLPSSLPNPQDLQAERSQWEGERAKLRSSARKEGNSPALKALQREMAELERQQAAKLLEATAIISELTALLRKDLAEMDGDAETDGWRAFGVEAH